MKSQISMVRVASPDGVQDILALVVSFDEVPFSAPVEVQTEFLQMQARGFKQLADMLQQQVVTHRSTDGGCH